MRFLNLWPKVPAALHRGRQLPYRAAENGIFEPFIYKNDHFAKTGSGQT